METTESTSEALTSSSQSSASEETSPRLRAPIRRKAKADADAHAAALTVLVKELNELSLDSTRVVRRVTRLVEDTLEASILSLGSDGLVRGLRASFFQDFLREVSQRGPGQELSRRQRATLVRPLNAVREALQWLIAAQLEPVANYARAPRAHAISSKANAFIRPSDYDRLMRVLSEHVPDPDQRFAHAALLLIFRAGVTFEGVLKGVCRLRVCDVHDDIVNMPQSADHARWLRVRVDSVCAQALNELTLTRATLTGKRGRPRKPVPLSPLAHLASGVEDVPDAKVTSRWRKSINAYLANLSAKAGVPANPVSAWLPVIRWVHAARGCSKPGVSYLAGQLETGLLPLEQRDADWHAEPAMPLHNTPAATVPSPTRPAHKENLGAVGGLVVDPPSFLDDLGGLAVKSKELRDLLRNKEDIPAVRKVIATELAALIESWRADDDAPSRNLTQLARWLAHLLEGKKRLGTLRAYLCDGLWLTRFAGAATVASLGDADVEAVTEPDGRRRLSAWLSWRAHTKACGAELAHLGKRNTRRRKVTVEETLLPPEAMTRLCAALDGAARIAAIAGYFGMLRIDEVLHLRLCDMALAGDAPYLEIRNAKGGKSRRVYLSHAPAEAVRWLRDAQMRLLSANPGLPLAERMRRRLVDTVKTKLEREMRRALRAIGFASCTFHDLRKSRATALVQRGVDVRLVSRWLGHATTNVTWGSYVHRS